MRRRARMKFLALTVILSLLSIAAFRSPTPVRAGDDGLSRHVEGGDIIYSALATAPVEQDALYQAESRAIRLIAIECLVAPKGMRVFKSHVKKDGRDYVAEVEAGVSFDECEQAKHATDEQRKSLTHPLLATLKLDLQDPLESKINCREKLRAPFVERQRASGLSPRLPVRLVLASPAKNTGPRLRGWFASHDTFMRSRGRLPMPKLSGAFVPRCRYRHGNPSQDRKSPGCHLHCGNGHRPRSARVRQRERRTRRRFD